MVRDFPFPPKQDLLKSYLNNHIALVCFLAIAVELAQILALKNNQKHHPQIGLVLVNKIAADHPALRR